MVPTGNKPLCGQCLHPKVLFSKYLSGWVREIAEKGSWLGREVKDDLGKWTLSNYNIQNSQLIKDNI